MTEQISKQIDATACHNCFWHDPTPYLPLPCYFRTHATKPCEVDLSDLTEQKEATNVNG